MGAPERRARAELAERLRARRAEIEQTILARVYGIADATEAPDPAYAEGLRTAVSAALDYGLCGIETGEERAPSPPPALLAQARVAVRSGVDLDTVLRRYFAGYALLGDFLMQEAEDGKLLRGPALKRVVRAQASLFDRLLAAVSEEYAREAANRPDTSERRRADRVRALLAGEFVETAELAYDFDAFHLGLVAAGPGALPALREVAGSIDCRLLLVRADERTAWAWLGGQRRLDAVDLGSRLSSAWPAGAALAIGEPGKGLAAWRLTHRQAAVALPVALRCPGVVVRYAEIALVASAFQDEVLSTSLRQLYLAPIEHGRDGGETARRTLRAYLGANRNVSSTASALGVSRRTVTNRLRAIEERIGNPLHAVAAELEVALHLRELDDST